MSWMVMLLHAISMSNLYCANKRVYNENSSSNGFCYTSSLVVLTLSFRTSRFPGASRSQPGGHEEQECSESGRHPTGYETLPVSPELLRAGNHTRCLHPRRCSGPRAFHFGENNERVKMSLLAFKGYHLFISLFF